MSDKLVFSLLNIYREFRDKTALNFMLYKVQNFYMGKMCISVFYFILKKKKKKKNIHQQDISKSNIN